MIEDSYKLYKFHGLDRPEKAWKQFAPLFELTPLKMADNAGAIENHTWIAGACIFAQVALDGNAHRHTQEHVEKSGDLLFVHRFLAGGADGRSEKSPFMLRPGMMIFHDYGRAFDGIQPPSVLQSAHIPHDIIGYDSEYMPACIIHDQNSACGSALFAAFDELMPDLLTGSDYLEKGRTQRFVDLVRAALPSPKAETPMVTKIQAFIEDHLGNPGLGIEHIQDAFQISRAQVFERFTLYGGFEVYLAARRTFNALFELFENASARGNLDSVSQKWGFRSVDALKRSVADQYNSNLDTIFYA